MKILVVDDEKTLVKGMKFNLENEGYEVECAYDGAAALEHLFLQYSAWSAVKLESLAPLRGLCALRTLDLGCRGAKDKVKLDFNMLYPQLDSLTITPSLKEYFITNTEAGR